MGEEDREALTRFVAQLDESDKEMTERIAALEEAHIHIHTRLRILEELVFPAAIDALPESDKPTKTAECPNCHDCGVGCVVCGGSGRVPNVQYIEEGSEEFNSDTAKREEKAVQP